MVSAACLGSLGRCGLGCQPSPPQLPSLWLPTVSPAVYTLFRSCHPVYLFLVINVRVLSLRSSVIHGFVTEHWHSRHVFFVCECATSSVLEPCALSSACLVSCWSVVFRSRHSCRDFCVGVRTLTLHVLSHCVSVGSRVRSVTCSTVHMCCVLCCCMQFVFLSFLCSHVISCAVRHAAYVFHWLRAFMSYLCCHVLCEHMAYEYSY